MSAPGRPLDDFRRLVRRLIPPFWRYGRMRILNIMSLAAFAAGELP
jgi:hypothetical protein